jgi:hypothetical protein
MVAVVFDPETRKYVPAVEWRRAEALKAAELTKQAKMPSQEEYDLSYRSPMSSTKVLGYDFSQ